MSSFQDSNCLCARDRREGIEEFIEAVSAFEVVYEIAKGHTRPLEHRCPAENLRIAVDHRGKALHNNPL